MPIQTFGRPFGLPFFHRSTAYLRTKSIHRPWSRTRPISTCVDGRDYWHFSNSRSGKDEFLAGAAPSGGRRVCYAYHERGCLKLITLQSFDLHYYRDPSGEALTAELENLTIPYLRSLSKRPSIKEAIQKSRSSLGSRPPRPRQYNYGISLAADHNWSPSQHLLELTIALTKPQNPGGSKTYWNLQTRWRTIDRAGLQISIGSKHTIHTPILDQAIGNHGQTWDRSHPMWKLAETELRELDYDPVLELHFMLKKSAEKLFAKTRHDPPLVPLLSSVFQLSDSRNDVPCLDEVQIRINDYIKVPRFSTEKYAEHPHLRLSRAEYNRLESNFALKPSSYPHRTAYVAMGSNLGDTVANIDKACREMAKVGIMVNRSSSLYQSKPMYFEEQENFVNCVCEIQTEHEPMQLLACLKKIEDDLGRVKTIDNGPRPIDLDILLYDHLIYESERLSIPHKKMMEREFVLRPLCDVIPDRTSPTQNPLVPFRESLKLVDNSCISFTPLSKSRLRVAPLMAQSPTRATKLMVIVNMTPDSFSDGGLYSQTEAAGTANSILHAIGQSDIVSVIDVGGQSTRPHAADVAAEEEMSRVVPVIKALRSNPALDKVAISVDTYRSIVAAAAVAAGADIVNDVSAGQLDVQMLPTIAELGCPCVLMHMRGTPETMNGLTDYENGVIEGVGSELYLRLQDAEKAGIKRWRIILDPGIGFAKTQAQNLELLQRFDELRNYKGLEGLPWVVGVSRKRFIGKITGIEDPAARQFGSAVCVTAAIKGGADIVRVHDVGEMTQVVKMADAIYRA